MAIAHVASASNGGNPTTAFTITIPATVNDGDILVVSGTNGDGTGTPTISDNSGIGSWALVQSQAGTIAMSGWVWWKRVTNQASERSAIVSVGSLTGSSCGILSVYRGCVATGSPIDGTPVSEGNASGNNTQAGITTLTDGAMACLSVFYSDNTAATTGWTATSPATLQERLETVSSGGLDSGVAHASEIKTTAGATGNLNWNPGTSQVSVSIAFALKPAPLVRNQVAFRARNDDAGEPAPPTGATWQAAENANWTQTTGQNFRVRFVVQESGGAGSSMDFKVQYSKNGSAFTDVTTATDCRVVGSTFFIDDDITTKQLSAGTGTFQPGAMDDLDNVMPTGTWIDMPPNGNTEVEINLFMPTANWATGNTCALRLTSSTPTSGGVYSTFEGTYTNPTITASAGGTALTRSQTDPAAATDSTTLSQRKALAETAGAADAVAKAQRKTLLDAAAASDSFVAAKTRPVLSTDPAGAADSIAKAQRLSKPDTAGAVDSVSKAQRGAVADAAGASDALSKVRRLAVVDAAGASDAASKVQRLVVADAAGAADVATPVQSGGTKNTALHASLTDTTRVPLARVDGAQAVVLVRKTAGTGANPTVRVEVREAGGLVSTPIPDTAVGSTSGVVLSGNFDPSALNSINNAELWIIGTAGTGGSLEIGAARILVKTTPSTAVTRSQTDPAGAADALALRQRKVFSDAAGVADSATTARSLRISFSDAAGATDTAAKAQRVVATNAAGAVDSTTYLKRRAEIATDPAGAADSTSKVERHTLTDLAGAADTPATRIAGAIKQAVTDLAGAADSTVKAQRKVVADASGVADSSSSLKRNVQAVTDPAGATDSRSKVERKVLTDTAGAADAYSTAAAGTKTASATDTAGAADSISTRIAAVRSVASTAGASDSTSRLQSYKRSVADSAGALDATTKTQRLALSDAAGALDSRLPLLLRRFTATSAAAAVDSRAFKFGRAVTDAAGALDTTSLRRDIRLVYIDAAAAQDAVVPQSVVKLVFSDALPLADVIALGAPAQAPTGRVVVVVRPGGAVSIVDDRERVSIPSPLEVVTVPRSNPSVTVLPEPEVVLRP